MRSIAAVHSRSTSLGTGSSRSAGSAPRNTRSACIIDGFHLVRLTVFPEELADGADRSSGQTELRGVLSDAYHLKELEHRGHRG
jgi:hypothetical protein